MIEFDQGKDLAEYVGMELGVSDWVLVDRELIASFGRTTGDTHWVHMDEERARRETPFGGVIAHGFLVLSLVTGLSTQCFRVKRAERWLNYGLDRVRFPATVAANTRVRLRLTLVDIGQQAGGMRLQLGCVIEIEGGTRPAAVCDWLCVVFDGDEK